MHRSYAAIVTLVATVATLSACDNDASRPAPTQPAQAVALRPTTPVCDAALEKQINTEIGYLYTTNEITKQAKAYFDAVVAACQAGDQLTARANMFTYVKFTITQSRANPIGVTSKQAVVDHWDVLFQYVRYAGSEIPNLPVSVLQTRTEVNGALGVVGGVDVIFGTVRFVATADGEAGVYVPTQTNETAHLVSLLPITVGTSTRANCVNSDLQRIVNTSGFVPSPCYDITAFPAYTTTFSPRAVVVVCQSDAMSATDVKAPTLSHEVSGGQTVLTYPLRTDNGNQLDETKLFKSGAYLGTPTLCQGDVTLSAVDGPLMEGWQAVTRLASRALDVLRPKSAYAYYWFGPTSLSGSTGSFSPFGGVNGVDFFGSFSDPALFKTYTDPTPPAYSFAAERGTWYVDLLKSPSSITVQESFYDLTGGVAVLSQGGGNCTKTCGGLRLRGQLFVPGDGTSNGQYPSYGQYSVSWRSLQAKPTLKVAPFVLRSLPASGKPLGYEIARVAYETGMNNSPIITYNGEPTGVLWVQNQSQEFEVIVNFDKTTQYPKGSTTLRLVTSRNADGTVATATTIATKGFVEAAPNLASITADFTGIDAGTVAWDLIRSKASSNGNNGN